MSSSYRARRGGSGGGSRQLQFPVGGRVWRHVAVVDAGCGCRPRRATTRLLSQLPSFLRPSTNKQQMPVGRSSSRSSSGFFPSSASTASSATFTTTHSSYSSAYDYTHSHQRHQVEQQAPSRPKLTTTTTSARKRQKKKKKQYEKMAAAGEQDSNCDDGVGVAVEKESSDPRADFRESMVQMVVQMGLCGWDDLRCMLRRLLALNAPRHHAAILAAFAEVCAQLTAPPPPVVPEPPFPQPQPVYGQYHAYDDYHCHY